MELEKYFEATQKFHRKFKMKGTNNEDMNFRLNLMLEELGELAQAITRGKSKKEIIEENVDLFNLILGNLISLGISIDEFDRGFWKKHQRLMKRKLKKINGNFRVSHYGNKKTK